MFFDSFARSALLPTSVNRLFAILGSYGAPARELLSPDSSSSLQSFPKSISVSSTTKLQFLQITSPLRLFMKKLLNPHSGHLSVCIMFTPY